MEFVGIAQDANIKISRQEMEDYQMGTTGSTARYLGAWLICNVSTQEIVIKRIRAARGASESGKGRAWASNMRLRAKAMPSIVLSLKPCIGRDGGGGLSGL